MIPRRELVEDRLDDELSELLTDFRRHATLTSDKRQALSTVMDCLKGRGYKLFRGHYSRYLLQRIGESGRYVCR